MGYYQLYRDAQGYWRWTAHASNGRKIADSGEGYVQRADALHGITLLKASAPWPVRG